MPDVERFIACSKINLGLEVLFRRTDGYHELNTLFYRTMEPHDAIIVRESDRFTFTCSDKRLATDSSNLLMKAAERFAAETGEALPSIHVHLEKNIPMGAGLGGGSSDAATMLHILQDRSTRPLEEEVLMRLGVSLGADVPFFLSQARAAIATGIGDKLQPIELALDRRILIVKDPTVAVTTKEAYANLNIKSQRQPSDLLQKLQTEPITIVNDFELSIFQSYPSLTLIKTDLYRMGAELAMMSGSGSALFGLFTSLEAATKACAYFERAGMQVYLNA